jgi:hypothetical protein
VLSRASVVCLAVGSDASGIESAATMKIAARIRERKSGGTASPVRRRYKDLASTITADLPLAGVWRGAAERGFSDSGGL